MAETMRVRANYGKTRPDGTHILEEGKVAFWERDDAHPDGEVYIADDKTYTVGETAAVLLALKDERIVRASEARRAEAEEAPKAAEAPKK